MSVVVQRRGDWVNSISPVLIEYIICLKKKWTRIYVTFIWNADLTITQMTKHLFNCENVKKHYLKINWFNVPWRLKYNIDWSVDHSSEPSEICDKINSWSQYVQIIEKQKKRKIFYKIILDELIKVIIKRREEILLRWDVMRIRIAC